MKIEAAETRRIEDWFGKQQSVSHHHRGIEIEGGKGALLGFAFQRNGIADFDVVRLGKFGDGGNFARQPSAFGAWGLGVDGCDLVALCDQRAKRGHGEIRRAHEGEAHNPTLRLSAVWLL